LAPEKLRWFESAVISADVGDASLLPELTGRVDAVLANPPYVGTGEDVDPEVPRSGRRPLRGPGRTRRAAGRGQYGETAAPLGGVSAVEHGDKQGTAITALLSGDDRWRQVVDHRDLAGRPRYLTAERTSFADDYSG
jgi:release factor glutamine methyltransferase